jgi:viologen exporter family transport system permease protein
MYQTILKFWYVYKLVWIERMTYRVNFIMEILSGILSSLIVIFLWIAIYRSAGKETIGGYSLREMVTYLLGGGLINSFILTTAENPETSQNIQDGTLSSYLIQPINPYGIWFFRDLGGKTFLFALGLLGYVVVCLFFCKYLVYSLNFEYLSFFLLSLLLASLLQFFMFQGFSLLSFWIENTYGIRFTIRVIMEVLAGAIIPLSFFPEILQKIFLLLPFHFLIYLPMNIYLGKIPLIQASFELLKEIGWITGFGLLNLFIWRKGVRQYVAHGD